MAWTFGGATTHKVDHTVDVAPFAINRTTLVTCWIYPTTLTATRCLWAAGAVWRLAVDTTTTSLRFTTDGTTDGAYTAPAGLATNTWTFVALLSNSGASGTVAAPRIWTGTQFSQPIERTVTTATAHVGAQISSSTTFTVGNTTGGSLSLQGDIGGVCVLVDPESASNNVLGVGANGSLSQADADMIFQRFVNPLWRGDLHSVHQPNLTTTQTAAGGTRGFLISSGMDNPISVWGVRTASRVAGTVTGAVWSQRRTPRTFDDDTVQRVTRRSLSRRPIRG